MGSVPSKNFVQGSLRVACRELPAVWCSLSWTMSLLHGCSPGPFLALASKEQCRPKVGMGTCSSWLWFWCDGGMVGVNPKYLQTHQIYVKMCLH